MNADEFPFISDEHLWSQWENIVFSASELKKILKKVIFAASQDESKPLFRGVLIEVDNEENILCMASDTYRLAHNQKYISKKKNIQPLRMLVPGKTLMEVIRILDDSDERIECFFRENEIIFKYRQFVFSGRLLEDKFPNFVNAFPAGFDTKIVVNTRLLEKTVGRASLLVQGQNLMISLGIKDKILQVRSGSEIGRMKEELVLEKKEGNDLEEILLNCRFFLDPLRILEDDFIEIEFNGPFGPCIFNCRQEQEDGREIYRYLVLPIKVDKKDY
jgi:DNA polymerase-3 subunit beta